MSTTDNTQPTPPESLPTIQRRRPPSPEEQARRIAWGKQAGAKVAAEYAKLQEANTQ